MPRHTRNQAHCGGSWQGRRRHKLALETKNLICNWPCWTLYPEYLFENDDLVRLPGNRQIARCDKAITLNIPDNMESFRVELYIKTVRSIICKERNSDHVIVTAYGYGNTLVPGDSDQCKKKEEITLLYFWSMETLKIVVTLCEMKHGLFVLSF